jgi:hypothetical protein
VGHDAVRSVDEVLDQSDVLTSLGGVARIDGLGAAELGVEIGDGRIELPVLRRLNEELDLRAEDICIGVLVDRGPVDDLADLQPLVVVVENARVELRPTVPERVLGTDLARASCPRCSAGPP